MTASRANSLKQDKVTDKLQSNPNNMDNKGRGGDHKKCPVVRTKRVEFRQNARAFFHQGQRNLSVIMTLIKQILVKRGLTVLNFTLVKKSQCGFHFRGMTFND